MNATNAFLPSSTIAGTNLRTWRCFGNRMARWAATLVTTYVTVTAGTSSTSMAQTRYERDGGTIPAQVYDPSRGDDEDGVCTLCQIDDFVLDNGADAARLELYFQDDGRDLEADIALYLLTTHGFRRVVLEDHTLLDQSLAVIDVPATDDWSFDDVHYAWVQVLPTK